MYCGAELWVLSWWVVQVSDTDLGSDLASHDHDFSLQGIDLILPQKACRSLSSSVGCLLFYFLI